MGFKKKKPTIKPSEFEETWNQVKTLKLLPATAIEQIPSTLSDDTKERLSKIAPSEVGRIIMIAVDEIDHGSIETVDALIRKQI